MIKAVFLSVALAALQSSAPSNLDVLTVASDLGDVRNNTPKLHAILVDAKALGDFESVVSNFPDGKCVDKDTILALIKTHKEAAAKDISKDSVQEVLRKNMQIILDGKKATKRAEDLEREVERLRKKIEDKRR